NACKLAHWSVLALFSVRPKVSAAAGLMPVSMRRTCGARLTRRADKLSGHGRRDKEVANGGSIDRLRIGSAAGHGAAPPSIRVFDCRDFDLAQSTHSVP